MEGARRSEHGFHATKQGVRYTISEAARREVLARLLTLNHARYAEDLRSQDRGYGIAHPTTQNQTPLLADLTMQKTFSDGTKPPLAALHVNNYYGTSDTLRRQSQGAGSVHRWRASTAIGPLPRQSGAVRYVRTVATIKLP